MRLIVRRLNSPLIASKASAIATSGMRKPRSAINDGSGSCENVRRRRKRNGLSPIVARIERIAAYAAAIAVRNTKASRMRIRALDRWSAVSLATTAPSPVQGEPLRPPRQLLSGIARLLEIAGVDLVEARRGKVDADQLDLRGEAPGDLGPQIALAIDPVALAVRPLAERLHLVEMVRRQKDRGPVGFEPADHLEEFLRRMRVERGRRLVEDRHARALHQDLGEPQALAHALRKRADP